MSECAETMQFAANFSAAMRYCTAQNELAKNDQKPYLLHRNSAGAACVMASKPPKSLNPMPRRPRLPKPVAGPVPELTANAILMPEPTADPALSVGYETTAERHALTIAPQPVAAAAAPTAQEEITMDVTENIQAATDNAATKGQAYFADMNDRAKAAVAKSSKLAEELNDFSKGNVEAMVESGRIYAKGLEAMTQEAADYTRRSFETFTTAIKSMSSVKSPTELVKLHSDYVRSSFDSVVAETSKNTESMLKLAGDVAQPLSNRLAVAAEKIKVDA